MASTNSNGLDAANNQSAETQTNYAADFIENAVFFGAFPTRLNTVTAEVLCRFLQGENLTGMDAVYCASTTRLAAVVEYLEKAYNWKIDRVDINVGCNDGRVAVVRAYYLNRPTIRRAFDFGALEFCQSVKEARAKNRKHALKAKAEATKRNAARAAAKFDPNQYAPVLPCIFSMQVATATPGTRLAAPPLPPV
jgi:hypothetical protein